MKLHEFVPIPRLDLVEGFDWKFVRLNCFHPYVVQMQVIANIEMKTLSFVCEIYELGLRLKW